MRVGGHNAAHTRGPIAVFRVWECVLWEEETSSKWLEPQGSNGAQILGPHPPRGARKLASPWLLGSPHAESEGGLGLLCPWIPWTIGAPLPTWPPTLHLQPVLPLLYPGCRCCVHQKHRCSPQTPQSSRCCCSPVSPPFWGKEAAPRGPLASLCPGTATQLLTQAPASLKASSWGL